MTRLRRFALATPGLATIEYVIGAAVVLGTLAVGVSAWNNGLVARPQALVAQMQAGPRTTGPAPAPGLRPPRLRPRGPSPGPRLFPLLRSRPASGRRSPK